MDSPSTHSLKAAPEAPQFRLPAWLRAQKGEPLFLAGAALGALHEFLREPPVWTGVWAQRLALRAAAAACRHLGRSEDEPALRDFWQLRSSDEAVGPSGAVLQAYLRLTGRRSLEPETFRQAALAFGGGQIDTGDLLTMPNPGTGEVSPLVAAAHAAATIANTARGREGELLALWVADAVLAQNLGWKLALPLHSIGMLASRARAPRCDRPFPGAAEWPAAAALAVATTAVTAIDLGADTARRAARLEAAATKVRTKKAEAAIAMLLREDAVTPARIRGKLSDRAARRLLERLVKLGGARELSGRSTFRIYGL